MRTDRELLELAARAAGYDFHWRGLNGVLPSIGTGADQEWWNPLNANADALRLVVRLRLDMSFLGSMIEVCWFDEAASANRSIEERINDAQGECEATRRAIVRAAAEIAAQHPRTDGGGRG